MIINLSVLLFKKSNIVGENDFENMFTLNFQNYKKSQNTHLLCHYVPVMVVAAVVD